MLEQQQQYVDKYQHPIMRMVQEAVAINATTGNLTKYNNGYNNKQNNVTNFIKNNVSNAYNNYIKKNASDYNVTGGDPYIKKELGYDDYKSKKQIKFDYTVLSVTVMTLALIIFVEVIRHQVEHSAINRPFFQAVLHGVSSECTY